MMKRTTGTNRPHLHDSVVFGQKIIPAHHYYDPQTAQLYNERPVKARQGMVVRVLRATDQVKVRYTDAKGKRRTRDVPIELIWSHDDGMTA